MRTLCWADLRDGTGTGNLKSINQLRLLLGDNTSAEAYRNLTFAHKKAIINYESKNSLCMPIHEFLNKKFKGSRKFRDLMMEAERKKKAKCPLNNYLKIAGLDGGIVNETPSCSASLNSMWTLYFAQSDFKTFVFKLHHNILGLNSRVHHFNQDRDPACFFCIKTANFPAEKETFTHFFWYCPTTSSLLKRFFSKYFNREPDYMAFLTGLWETDGRKEFSNCVAIVCSVLKYCLWIFKLRKKLPSWHSFESEFFYFFNVMLGSSNKHKLEVQRCQWLKRRDV
jgi:hypothetical protein